MDSNVPLWLSTAPAWVLSQLEGLEFDCQIQETKQVKEHKGMPNFSFLFHFHTKCTLTNSI